MRRIIEELGVTRIHRVSKTVACFIFYNLKNLEPALIISAHYILIVLASKSIRHFPPHLIFTFRTLQYFWLLESAAFHVNVKVVNMPLNNNRILIKDLNLLKGYITQKSYRTKEFPRKHFN